MSHEVQQSPGFDAWLDSLPDKAARRAILARIVRLKRGLFGDRRSVGDRVSELKVDVGQGYRLYYTMGGRALVLLLCGGSKKTQKTDIRRAEAMVKAMSGKKGSASRVRERPTGYAVEPGEPIITDDDIAFTPFDAADYMRGDIESQTYLLRDALDSGHPGYIADAIGAVARARGLTSLERATGIKRQTLNKSLSLKGNPTLETLVTVLGALGLRLEVVEDGPGNLMCAPASTAL
ncbi:MAG TPA: type II toxin-antitoxin system RelE/ParE family toxin [Allosphingosinicella sp.]|nr:type II toxin-antitoxin system RelE/ParE family toxin [Allosphingosinicella sp.]